MGPYNNPYMYYSLNSLKGVIWGIISGTTIGDIKGDTRSLDYSSYNPHIYAPKVILIFTPIPL